MAIKTGIGFSRMLLWASLAILPLGVAITLFDATKARAVDPEQPSAKPAAAQAGETQTGETQTFALPPAVSKGTTVKLDGAESMAAFSQSLKQSYEGQFVGAAVNLSSSGTEQALKRLSAGEIDLAAIARSLTEAEKAQGLTPVILDREKIAIVVGKENPFAGDIGYAQFARIFRGEIKDWSALGGSAGPIRLIDRPETSDTRQSLKTYPAFQSAPFQTGTTAEPLSEENTAAMVAALGKDGVGYALYSQVKDLPGIKVIPMHKVLPDNAAYPYSQPRVLVYKGEPNEAVSSFLGLATNAPGQAAINAVEAAEAQAVAAGKNPALNPTIAAQGAIATSPATSPASSGTGAQTPATTATDAATPQASPAGAPTPGAEAGATPGATTAPAEGTTPDGAIPETGREVSAADGGAIADKTPKGSILWGLLPLAALAAGGGLLWWLAAGAGDDEESEGRSDRTASPDTTSGTRLGGTEGSITLPETGVVGAVETSTEAVAQGDRRADHPPIASPLAPSEDSTFETLEETVPEDSVPEGSVPESSVPEGSVPESSIPESSVPEDSVLEDSVLEDSVLEDSAIARSTPQFASAPHASPTGAIAGAGLAAAGLGAAGLGAAGLAAAGTAMASDRPDRRAPDLSTPNEGSIESVLQEKRLFYPSEEFSRAAQIKSLDDYHNLYVRAKADPAAFWDDLAQQELEWFEPWEQTLVWNPPEAQWFKGGKLNITHNCLDRHLTDERRNKPAIIWEGEPGDSRVLTYAQLHREVCLFANGLKKLGITKGDVVGIYMPMVPEAAIAMLACARIGAPHSVVFGGFSAEALRDRLNDGQAKLVITADGGWRKDAIVELKTQVDQALENNAAPSVENVLVVQRTRQTIPMQPGRDHWWHDLRQTVPPSCPAEPMDSEDPLFILYTSGSTGKPKGVVHTTGGYNLYTHVTTKWIFDLQEDDIYWCTADVGWITGHSYIVYGPLSNGASSLMYEGAPRKSNPGCFWDVIEKYKVSVFYTAPTAIRAFIKMGEALPQARDLSSLRLLGTVGEPINPEAWMWYHRVIGGERCPIVDTWWQTETGGIMISPLPGAIPTKPGSATRPFPGIMADVVDLNGNPVPTGEGGYLVIRHPWPSMLRTVHGDPERFRKTYWEQIPGEAVYFAGDGARIDEDGYFWVMGRVDDVISVSGHRLGTMEIESALVSHPAVAEAAVVGRPDEVKGEEVFAFVTLEGSQAESESLMQSIKDHVVQEIGALARPSEIRFTDALPKTRSGKIMRRLLRKVAAGEEVSGDTSTLEDRSVLDQLRSGE